MAYEDLILEKEEAIAIITLNVPDKLNPITGKMGVSLSLAADRCRKGIFLGGRCFRYGEGSGLRRAGCGSHPSG
jgi:enoyl-CoA hydratase/carnithine racemase